MELEKRNIQLLLKISAWKFKKNWRYYIKYLLCSLYLIGGFTYILWYLKTSQVDCSWPLGGITIRVVTILMYLLYVILNHIIIYKLIRHDFLLLIEITLIVSLFIIL